VVLWSIILASACAAGLVILHAFSRWKGGGDQLLETYQHLLTQAAKQRDRGTRRPSAAPTRGDESKTAPANEEQPGVP
jgi:hypothetical protein